MSAQHPSIYINIYIDTRLISGPIACRKSIVIIVIIVIVPIFAAKL